MHRASIAAILAVGLSAPAGAQDAESTPAAARPEKPAAEAADQKPDRRTSQDLRCTPTASLRVHLVITRFQGEKKEASLPYTFVVAARTSTSCSPNRVQMRMGVDTPVPVVTFDADDPKRPKSTSFQYKTVGTNIDCSADDLGDGRFGLFLRVENSSTLSGSRARESDELSGFPLFRRFETSLNPILRDGQSAQTVASTDPVTGEVMKIDVTLHVVK